MTEQPSLPQPPAPSVQPSRAWRRPSLVWLIPLLAALVGLGLVVQTFWQQGPSITVSFSTAQGIEPGKTKVRFKDVEIGQVRTVHIAKDRNGVLVTIDLINEAREFAATDSRFWVVRPRLAGTAISGLETVLSGAYIGVDGGHSGQYQSDFTGLEEPPVVASDVPGHRFRLRADDIGSLDVGSPVYFRRIAVGHVESFSLENDGSHIQMGIFVKSPYDRFVTDDARFWHASGVDLKMDANGVKIETQSLATILMGGIAFENMGNTDAPIAASDREFALAANRADAVKAPEGDPVTMMLRFHQSIRGLTVGAPVAFRGVEIGHVQALGIAYDPVSEEFTAPVTIEIYPQRLTAMDPNHPFPKDGTGALAVANLVRRGLRAQLRSGSLLTGQLYVSIDFFPTAAPARYDAHANPPELPTIPGDLEELEKQVQTILAKLSKLPLDELADDTHRTLVALEGNLKRMDKLEQHVDSEMLPEIRDGLHDLRSTMDGLQQTMAPDAPLQQDSRAALQNMATVARSLKTLTDSLDRHPESLLRGKNGENQ